MSAGQIALSTNFWKNDLQAGVYGFISTSTTISLTSVTRSRGLFSDHLAVVHRSERRRCRRIHQRQIQSYLVADFDGRSACNGVQLVGAAHRSNPARFRRNGADPRFGVAIRIPRLNWVFRGFYGYYYQAPPLSTATDSAIRPGSSALSPPCTANGTENGSTGS